MAGDSLHNALEAIEILQTLGRDEHHGIAHGLDIVTTVFIGVRRARFIMVEEALVFQNELRFPVDKVSVARFLIMLLP